MNWFKKKAVPKVNWTETQICLYERQMAAREAMGRKWRCHPANGVVRQLTYRGVPIILDGIPTVYPPKLRIVK